ncbi:MAG TPA: Gfo/Idh/MocA family oxidoreductase [Anaerolineaceae bacterium]
MGNALRVAVIGAGQIAQRGHLPGYTQAGAELVALCDSTHPELEAITAKYHVKRAHRDWKEMFAEGGFDAVSICTPPFLHCEMSVEALRRGYHVLVEKPMAMSLAECDQIIEAAQKSKTLLMVSHNQRFMAVHQLAKAILDSGELGKPYLIHGVFGHSGPEVWSPTQTWYFQRDRAGRGVITDLGYHKLDIICWITGQNLAQIGAFSNTFEKATDLEDTAVFSFQLSGGMLGTLQVSWVFRPDWENSLTLRCERGVIRVPTEATDPVRVIKLDNLGRVVESEHVCKTQDISGWFGAVQAFVTAIQTGGPSPVPGTDGRAVLAAVLAASEAIEQKKTVSLA